MQRVTWCGLATVAVLLMVVGNASAQQAVKPWVHVIVDTSGSMGSSAGSGLGSRMQEVVAALSDITAGVGEVTFGLQSFIDESQCDSCPCNGANRFCAGGDVHEGFTPGNQDVAQWVDGTCSIPGGSDVSNPVANGELGAYGGGNTPIQANLETALSYMENSVIPADDKKLCRPYVVVFMTDGEENCGNSNCSGSVTAVQGLCGINVPGRAAGCTVPTYMIGLPGANLTCLNNIQDDAGTTRTTAITANSRTDLALAFQQIVADSVLVEVCDEANDEDCDGEVDEGFQLYCNLPGGETDNVLCDNPGDPCDGVDDNCFDGINDEVRNACGTCGAAPAEQCDELDNDCDGFIDEGLSCSPACTPSGNELCNAIDDDCDGLIDEADPMDSAACGSDQGACTPGRLRCINGSLECVGGTQPRPEVCDGLDQDCDDVPDNDAECPPMSLCIEAACRPQCDPGEEFPCPVGLGCEVQSDGKSYCVPSACASCSSTERCQDRTCVDLCADVSCEGDDSCLQGVCVTCAAGGCPSGEICVDDACVQDPCEGVSCQAGQACMGGECRTPCTAQSCQAGQVCTSDWQCVDDPCAEVTCASGEACVDGECQDDACSSIDCADNQACVPGKGCVNDPCQQVDCGALRCQATTAGVAECTEAAPDPRGGSGSGGGSADEAPVEDSGRIIVAGGACSCEVGADPSASWPIALSLLLLLRRRRS